jgi:hypothetical protein
MNLSPLTTTLLLQLIIPFTKIATQVVYNNINSYISSYFTYKAYSKDSNDDDYEKELDKLHLPQLLKWMKTFFDLETEKKTEKNDNENNENNEKNEKKDIITKEEYFKELYSIYKTIFSDHKQYARWKAYNESLYFLKSYRSYSTNQIAKKIIYDVHLFNEGVNLFCKLR